MMVNPEAMGLISENMELIYEAQCVHFRGNGVDCDDGYDGGVGGGDSSGDDCGSRGHGAYF